MPTFRALLAAPLVFSLLVPGTACPSSEPHLTPAASYLPRLLVQGDAPAAALLARNSATAPGRTYASAGPGIRQRDRFRAGSVTKTFVATVILQLAGEGRLKLSSPVERYLPGLIRGHGHDGRRITLRALLTHTSGLPDHAAGLPVTVPSMTGRAGPSVRPPSAEAVVRAATARRPAAAPGRYAYSNTGYLTLGLVIQRVTGHSYASEIRRRVLVPLRLGGTSLPGARTGLPAPHSRGYYRDPRDGSLRDVTAMDPRLAGAAGEMVSTLADLNRFYAALLCGWLLPPAQQATLLNTRAAHGSYGMGVYPEKLSCGITVWGHNGRTPGSYVRTAATRDGRHILTFRINTDTLSDTRLEPALLEAEFCRP
ncbi:beta-lactamase family protein [Streptomyces sp. NBC_00654]|uniref:serine hydrolase domain-containing protein n=1 Tax=Streptomyces sp. NBC_00654 TaxID=2975799 RepID=UPI00224CE803|nr:serine hydrolase domain-containing protein [Streptomyces sp. NBC_00654]MCX4964314.1 beta-lactamase family protein [Streptomyces sp. NBC_00654]